jgi:hypothetical protein
MASLARDLQRHRVIALGELLHRAEDVEHVALEILLQLAVALRCLCQPCVHLFQVKMSLACVPDHEHNASHSE